MEKRDKERKREGNGRVRRSYGDEYVDEEEEEEEEEESGPCTARTPGYRQGVS